MKTSKVRPPIVRTTSEPGYVIHYMSHKHRQLTIFILSQHYEIRYFNNVYRMWDLDHKCWYDKMPIIYQRDIVWLKVRGVIVEEKHEQYNVIKPTETMRKIYNKEIRVKPQLREDYFPGRHALWIYFKFRKEWKEGWPDFDPREYWKSRNLEYNLDRHERVVNGRYVNYEEKE